MNETETQNTVTPQVIKKSTRKASYRAKKTLAIMIEKGGSVSSAMKTAGYSENYAHNPHKLINSVPFKILLAGIDDSTILDRLNEIIFKGHDRDSLNAIDILLKLKDRYPAGKLKLTEYQEELNSLQDTPQNFPAEEKVIEG